MQPDSERSILLQDTQIYAVGLMVWHLLLNSTSSWIHMKRTFFFSSLYKRLELGGFSWPRTKEEALEITPEQYQALMQGLEIVSRHPVREVHPRDLL